MEQYRTDQLVDEQKTRSRCTIQKPLASTHSK